MSLNVTNILLRIYKDCEYFCSNRLGVTEEIISVENPPVQENPQEKKQISPMTNALLFVNGSLGGGKQIGHTDSDLGG